MRIGLIADIHGNSYALAQALDVFERHHCDQIVCLGDVSVLGPDPEGAAQLIRQHADVTVLGNVDRWLLNGLSDQELRETQTEELRILTKWSLESMTRESIEMFEGSRHRLDLECPGSRFIRLFHGSSYSEDDALSATTPEAEVEAQAGDAVFVASGHTHIAVARRTSNSMLVNPGSVGLPGVGPGSPDLSVNRDVGWTEFAIAEVTQSSCSVTLCRIDLDLGAMFDWARSCSMPALDWWLSKWRSSQDDVSPSQRPESGVG